MMSRANANTAASGERSSTGHAGVPAGVTPGGRGGLSPAQPPVLDAPSSKRPPISNRSSRSLRSIAAVSAALLGAAAVAPAGSASMADAEAGWSGAERGLESERSLISGGRVEGKGVDLLDAPGVRIYEDDPLVKGESIVLGRGSSNGVLLDVDLGGSSSPRYRVSVRLEYTRRSLDFDPLIYITDGRDAVGARFMEARGGASSLITGRQPHPKMRPTVLQAISLQSDAQLPPVGERGELSVTLDMRGPQARVGTRMGESRGSASIDTALDRADGLSLQIARGINALQGLQIDSMRASLRPLPCGRADLAEPYGEFTIEDTRVFMERFNALESSADLTGEGAVNLYDVVRFAELHARGCDD